MVPAAPALPEDQMPTAALPSSRRYHTMAWARQHRRALLATAAVAALMVRAFVFDAHIPMLAYVDLGFHELGHMLAIPLGTVPHFLAGSGTQMAVPVGLAAYFWRKAGDGAAAGLMLAWAATSFQNTSVYIADAPTRFLPLLGGGTHDWWFLLSRWDALHLAGGLAGMVWFVGLLLGVGGLVVAIHEPFSAWRRSARAEEIAERFAEAPVREASNPPAEGHPTPHGG